MKTLAVLVISLLPWLAALDAERPEPSAPPPFGDTNKLAPPLDARPWSTNDATASNAPTPPRTNDAPIKLQSSPRGELCSDYFAKQPPPGKMLNPSWIEEECALLSNPSLVHFHTNLHWIATPALAPAFADGVLIATAVLRQNPGFAGLLSPQEQVALCLRVWQQRVAQGGGK